MEDPLGDRRLHRTAGWEVSGPDSTEWSDSDRRRNRVAGRGGVMALDDSSRTSFRWLEDADTGERRLLLADDRFWTSSRVCLLSSHRGRRGDRYSSWWDAFRDALLELAESDRLVLTAAGTPADPWLRTAVKSLGIQLAELRLPRAGMDVEAWLREVLSARPAAAPSFVSVCDISPPIPEASLSCPATSCSGNAASDDRRDALLLALAEEARVLFVRDRGRIADLLDRVASRSDRALSGVLLDTRKELISPTRDVVWRSHGAVRCESGETTTPIRLRQLWRPSDHSKATGGGREEGESAVRRSGAGAGAIRSWAEVRAEMEAFLSHWTRECPGPWPGQTEEAYLLEMMIDPNARRRSALDSLLRIVREQRLRASRRLVRGDTPVVSLTARPLDAFASLRRFQRHLGRWDFNPFGISLQREWLRLQGARPVQYGDQRVWERLAEEQRPFFQCSRIPIVPHDRDERSNQVRSGASDSAELGDGPTHSGDAGCRDDSPATADWTLEEEWRHVGDIDLSLAPPDVVRVFVGDSRSARAVSEFSPWTIVNLEETIGAEMRARGKKRSPRA